MSAVISEQSAGAHLNLSAQLTPASEIVCTMADIERVFTVWEQQFRDDAEAHNAAAARLEQEAPHVYGREAAVHFVELLEKQVPSSVVYNIAPPASNESTPTVVHTGRI